MLFVSFWVNTPGNERVCNIFTLLQPMCCLYSGVQRTDKLPSDTSVRVYDETRVCKPQIVHQQGKLFNQYWSQVRFGFTDIETLETTRRKPEPKWVPQVFLESLLRTCRSAIGFFLPVPGISSRCLCKRWLGPVPFSRGFSRTVFL